MLVTRVNPRSVSVVLMLLVLLSLLLLPTLRVTALDGPTALSWIHNPATNHDYAVLADCAGWHACEDAAIAEGAHLVTVNDASEQAWLVTQFGGAEHYWIGLSDEAATNTWVWTSGEPLTFTNWHSGEPSHSGGTEHYVLMNWAVPGEWNDGHSLASTVALIEKQAAPQPTYTPTTTPTATGTPFIRPTSTQSLTPTITATPPGPERVYLVVIYRLDLGYLPGG